MHMAKTTGKGTGKMGYNPKTGRRTSGGSGG